MENFEVSDGQDSESENSETDTEEINEKICDMTASDITMLKTSSKGNILTHFWLMFPFHTP